MLQQSARLRKRFNDRRKTLHIGEHGIGNVRVCEIGHSSKEELNNLESHFNSMPLEFYQLETMILEADKV